MGGGTAGLTIAARLAENPSISVAVVEAGGFYEIENGNISQVPAYDITYDIPSSTPPPVDWGFTTEPQKVFVEIFLQAALPVNCTSDPLFLLRVTIIVKSTTRKAKPLEDREF